MKAFKSLQELIGWEIYGYEQVGGGCSCQYCGKSIKQIVMIRNGAEKSILGVDCARKVASANNVNSMAGISNLPEKHRSKVKVNKKSYISELDEMTF